MTEAENILNKEIKLISNFSVRDIGFFFLIIAINYSLLVGLKINLNSTLFIFFIAIETLVWVFIKSFSIKAYAPFHYLNLINFYFRNLNHSGEKYFGSYYKDTQIYHCQDLINHSWLDEKKHKQIDKSFSNLIKNLYQIDNELQINFRIFISNEKEYGTLFHPKRNLYFEITSIQNHSLIEEEINNFSTINNLKLERINSKSFINYYKIFTGIKVYIKERKDYLKTKYYISNLSIKNFKSEHFSLNELIKKIPCKSELNLKISFKNHEKLSKVIKLKKNIIKHLNPQNHHNHRLLVKLENLEKHISKDEIYIEEKINIRLISQNKDSLKINENSLFNQEINSELVRSNFSEYQSFINNYISKTSINLNELKQVNPFIEDRIGTPQGETIAFKADDNSFVKFDIFNKNFSNNYSINFIGDSGSGKSLAAKLLMKRLSKNTKNKFIIIDSSLHGWETISEELSGNIENFENPSNIDSSINSIKNSQLSLFNFYAIEKDVKTSQSLILSILEEITKLVKEQKLNYFLIIDEAWKLLINENSKVSCELLSKVARTGRSMNIGLWTLSQKPKDINRDIHSNASNSFIFQIKEENDKDEISKYLSINKHERDLLNSFEIKQRGFALMKNQYFSGLIKFTFEESEFQSLNSEYKIC